MNFLKRYFWKMKMWKSNDNPIKLHNGALMKAPEVIKFIEDEIYSLEKDLKYEVDEKEIKSIEINLKKYKEQRDIALNHYTTLKRIDKEFKNA